jgi:hypothetical protein
MPDLSPAAQAVVDAAITGRGYLQPAIAAALRAVSEHGKFVILDDLGDGDFVVHVAFLCAIAAELEA